MTRSYDCDHSYDPTRHSPHGPCCEHPRECHPPVGLDLDKLESLHQSTTPGPWKVRQAPTDFRFGGINGFIEAPRLKPEDAHAIEILGEDVWLYPTRDADMAWIVAAHEAFPAMLERIAALEKEVVELTEELEAVRQSGDDLDEL